MVVSSYAGSKYYRVSSTIPGFGYSACHLQTPSVSTASRNASHCWLVGSIHSVRRFAYLVAKLSYRNFPPTVQRNTMVPGILRCWTGTSAGASAFDSLVNPPVKRRHESSDVGMSAKKRPHVVHKAPRTIRRLCCTQDCTCTLDMLRWDCPNSPAVSASCHPAGGSRYRTWLPREVERAGHCGKGAGRSLWRVEGSHPPLAKNDWICALRRSITHLVFMVRGNRRAGSGEV